jgi:Ca2+-binding RTX toxin-like protein
MDIDDGALTVLHHGAHDPGGLLRAAPDRPFDMDSLPTGRAAFSLSSVASGLIRLDANPSRYIEIFGAFTVAGGSVAGGTVTGIRLGEGGVVLMDLTNVPANPVTLVAGLLGRDAASVEHVLFGGADEIWGSGLGDTLTGHGGDDSLMGGAGADFIRGLGDADVIEGGDGDDDLNGNLGVDVVRGGTGSDTVRGGQDGDYVFGDAGDDPHLNGNLGDDEVFGGDGRDTVFGGQGADMLFGEGGDDLVSGDLGADTLHGGAGADRFAIRAGGGLDWVADFNAAEGDRIQLDRGVGFAVTGYEGQVMIELADGARLGLAGVAGPAGDWIVFA